MINPFKQTITAGVKVEFGNRLSDLWVAVLEQFKQMPYENVDGGNDKHFFSIMFYGKKLFVAENEINGLTVMLPEEY